MANMHRSYYKDLEGSNSCSFCFNSKNPFSFRTLQNVTMIESIRIILRLQSTDA